MFIINYNDKSIVTFYFLWVTETKRSRIAGSNFAYKKDKCSYVS